MSSNSRQKKPNAEAGRSTMLWLALWFHTRLMLSDPAQGHPPRDSTACSELYPSTSINNQDAPQRYVPRHSVSDILSVVTFLPDDCGLC